MTHPSTNTSRERGPSARIVMTGASFDLAQETGISSIEPDLEAMEHIARSIGFTPLRGRMPPLFIVTRQADTAGEIQWPDDQLPIDTLSPNHARYHIAADLKCNSTLELVAKHEVLAKLARNMSATALTEVSIADWRKETSHVAEFAAGLLLGQRPLELTEPGSLHVPAASGGIEFSGEGTVQVIDAISQKPQDWPEPFKITY